MKILYFITSLNLGGAEKVTLNLAEKMVEKGHTVKIIYMFGNMQIFSDSEKIEIISLGLSSHISLIFGLFKLRKLILSFNPDVVHSHMYHANIYMRIYRLFFGLKKNINSAHSSIEGSKFGMLLYRYTNFLSNLNTNVSQNALNIFIEKGAFDVHKSRVVYNGVDINRFSYNIYNVEKKLNLIAIGRFSPEKDYFNLIDAISIVKNESKYNFNLSIVGDGADFLLIKKYIKKLELECTVHLLGRRDDISDLLKASGCLILSSKFEGLPTVIMEAMSCGCYVISTDCGGSAEIMKNDFGTLVPVSDSFALAKAIIQYLESSNDFLLQSSVNARKIIIDHFSLDSSVNVWEEIYKS
ncbi:glycosyltransferase [Acinetobacter sp. YH16057]|uniref:glycosyltransferase n=1 Tax=Acinetobacter sp. YH16057 TaxID=2601195 RepID=UPI0015D44E01|nr:glycosyltransferase [Acinetobacter sp. YH16057]